jgi:hypothetical protein
MLTGKSAQMASDYKLMPWTERVKSTPHRIHLQVQQERVNVVFRISFWIEARRVQKKVFFFEHALLLVFEAEVAPVYKFYDAFQRAPVMALGSTGKTSAKSSKFALVGLDVSRRKRLPAIDAPNKSSAGAPNPEMPAPFSAGSVGGKYLLSEDRIVLAPFSVSVESTTFGQKPLKTECPVYFRSICRAK